MTTGVLSWPNMRMAIMLNTGFFETSRYVIEDQMRVIGGNWDGAGQSVGNLQYNWGSADRLTELYNYMLNNYASVVQGVFGAETAKYDEFRNVCLTYTRANKVAWADTITDYGTPAGHAIIEPWKTILGDLLVTPECVAKYQTMMDAYYVPNALDLFKQLSCTSRAALASLFDLNVNRGRFYPCNTLVVDFDAIDANGALTDAEKEAQKIAAINNRGNDPTNAMDASASGFAQRRDAQANQGGLYFGATYDPETQFDINQEPAITEKSSSLTGVKLGELNIQNAFLGTTPIISLYLGANLIDSVGIEPYTTSKVPDTQFRTNSNSYSGFETGPISVSSGQKLWIDVQNFVAARTYYTLDGSTPTTSSTLYQDHITLTQSCTVKALTVSVSGVSEVVRTLDVTVTGLLPVTTVSPSTTVQNSTSVTVTLSATDATTTYYKMGTGAQQTYSAPFTVSQNTAGVLSSSIPVHYWSVGAGGTEAEKTITYDTSGAVPSKPVGTATNGYNSVRLDWAATTNTTAYTLYRSTVQGSLGTLLVQFLSSPTYTDNTAVNGTTYYYTIRAQNYGPTDTDSDQVTGMPGNIYSTDFGTQTVGSAPTGWTSRWVTGSETMTVVSDVTAPSGKVMRYSTTVDNNRRFWSWDGAPTHTGDWDMLVKWKISGLGTLGDIPIRAMAEVTGGTTAQYGYAGDMVTTPTMRIQDYTNSTVSTKATGGGISLSTNTWYWFRFNRTGDTLSLKMWADGSAEPLTWTIFATDTTPLATAGWFGLGFYDSMASATRDIAYFAISMDTGGIAPSP